MTATNPYLKTKIMTASPGELRQMLLDGAVRFAEKARQGIESGNYESIYEGVTRCQSILLELINSLRPEENPDLCNKLSGLYAYLYRQLMRASSERDLAIIDDVIRLLRYESETWQMVMDKLRDENTQAATNAGTIAEGGDREFTGPANGAAAGSPQASGPYQAIDPADVPSGGSLSIEG